MTNILYANSVCFDVSFVCFLTELNVRSHNGTN